MTSGPASVRFSRSIESGDTPVFSSAQEIHAAGPGLFGESVSIDSCGAPAAGGSCSGGDDATDMNRSAYCEHAGTSVMLLTDRLGYASVGTISQGAIENPDSLEFRSSADGSGLGYFAATAGSMNGIGTGLSPGYIENVREEITVSGRIHLDGSINWSSPNDPGNTE